MNERDQANIQELTNHLTDFCVIFRALLEKVRQALDAGAMEQAKDALQFSQRTLAEMAAALDSLPKGQE